jgi:DNA-directed RNA polymerase subunit M/transcription elongation factor TFIIS
MGKFELKPCPRCGSIIRPKSSWDGYDEDLSCTECTYSTGFQYVPGASEIWNDTPPLDAFIQTLIRISKNN